MEPAGTNSPAEADQLGTDHMQAQFQQWVKFVKTEENKSKKQNIALQTEIVSKERKISDQAARIEELKIDLKNKVGKLQAFDGRLEDKLKEIDNLTLKLEDKTKEAQDREAELKTKSEEIRSLEAKVAKLEKKNEETRILEEKLEEKKKELESLEVGKELEISIMDASLRTERAANILLKQELNGLLLKDELFRNLSLTNDSVELVEIRDLLSTKRSACLPLHQSANQSGSTVPPSDPSSESTRVMSSSMTNNGTTQQESGRVSHLRTPASSVPTEVPSAHTYIAPTAKPTSEEIPNRSQSSASKKGKTPHTSNKRGLVEAEGENNAVRPLKREKTEESTEEEIVVRASGSPSVCHPATPMTRRSRTSTTYRSQSLNTQSTPSIRPTPDLPAGLDALPIAMSYDGERVNITPTLPALVRQRISRIMRIADEKDSRQEDTNRVAWKHSFWMTKKSTDLDICLHVRTIKWRHPVEHGRRVACDICCDDGTPCIKRISKQAVILPLPDKLRGNAKPSDAGFWVNVKRVQ